MVPEPEASVPTAYIDTPAAVVHSSSAGKNTLGIDWPQAFSTAALAGVIAATLMMFPLLASGPGMIASGAMAAIMYHRRTLTSNPRFTIGGILGAMCGIIGFGIFTVFTAVVTLLTGTQRLRSALMDALNQYTAQTTDPQKLQMLEYFRTPAGLALILIMGLICIFLMFLVFATCGGVLGTVWVRRRRRP